MQRVLLHGLDLAKERHAAFFANPSATKAALSFPNMEHGP